MSSRGGLACRPAADYHVTRATNAVCIGCPIGNSIL